jgi:hypothetical protein
MVEPCCFGTQLSARIITIRRQLLKATMRLLQGSMQNKVRLSSRRKAKKAGVK